MNSPEKPPVFARWIFWIAGVYGLLILTPFYFMERQIGVDNPPPITHPEYYYGFVGVALVFQIVYLMIGYEPMRYRPLMLAAALAKSSFGIACIALFAQGRLSSSVLFFACIDLFLGLLFAISFWRTRNTSAA